MELKKNILKYSSQFWNRNKNVRVVEKKLTNNLPETAKKIVCETQANQTRKIIEKNKVNEEL